MNCKNCGAEITRQQTFCARCGTPIEAPKQNNKVWIIITAVVCCVALIISCALGGLYFYSKNKTVPEDDGFFAFDEGSNVKLNNSGKSNDEAYKNYAEVYENAIDKYGDLHYWNDDYLDGVCYAQLVDLNNDGIDEFYMIYGEDGEYVPKYTYEVWGYKGNNVELLDSGEPYGTNGGVVYAYICEHDGQKYIVNGGADAFEFCYYHGFDGDEFKIVKSIEGEFGEERYAIDNKPCSESEFNKQLDEWNKNSDLYELFKTESNEVINIINATKEALGIASKELDLKEIADNEIGNVIIFESHDYDNDSKNEAFVVSAEMDEEGYCKLPWYVYYINSDGKTQLMYTDSEKSCYYGDEGNNYIITNDGFVLFYYDKGGYGSGWWTDVYTVKNGEPIAIDSEGLQGLYQYEDGTLYTTKNEFAAGGGHSYPEHSVTYDGSRCKFTIN